MGNTVQVGRDFTIYYATGSKIHGLFGHKFASGTRIGFLNNLSYTAEHNTEVYHGVGKREGWGIKEGALDVTLHLEGLWIDSGAHTFFLNQSERSGALTAFAIGFSGSDRGLAASGARLGTLDVDISSDGWATKTVDIPVLVID